MFRTPTKQRFSRLIFNSSPDPFIDARAKAISSGVSGTIFRNALRRPEGLQAVFDLPNGMLDITSRVYVGVRITLTKGYVIELDIDRRNTSRSLPK